MGKCKIFILIFQKRNFLAFPFSRHPGGFMNFSATFGGQPDSVDFSLTLAPSREGRRAAGGGCSNNKADGNPLFTPRPMTLLSSLLVLSIPPHFLHPVCLLAVIRSAFPVCVFSCVCVCVESLSVCLFVCRLRERGRWKPHQIKSLKSSKELFQEIEKERFLITAA